MEDQVAVHRRTKGAVVDALETCYVDVYGGKTGIALLDLHHRHHLVGDQGKAEE